jgi:hypothetical protein
MVGALLGLAHAAYIYRVVAHGVPADGEPSHARGLYFALWTLGLWVLFGSYVLILWLIGVLLYTIFKAFR